MPQRTIHPTTRSLACSVGLAAIVAASSFAACEASEAEPVLQQTATGGSGNATATGAGGTAGGGASEGGFDPNPNPCRGHAGDIICEAGVAITCGADEEALGEQDCGEELCVEGTGCVLCLAGQFGCRGNEVVSCNTGPPLQWDTVDICDPTAAEKCNSVTGQCEVLQPIGNGPANTTGAYYQYAYFLEGASTFLGGCDTDSHGSLIYVNRGNWYEDGQYLDVYQVELLDSDGDGLFEPNQHPDNPDAPGPIEERVLTLVHTYNVPELGMVHHSEVYAEADRVFLLNAPSVPGNLFEYVFSSGTTTTPISSATPAIDLAQLGYDDVSGVWYASNEWARRVYSYHLATNSWVAEFAYPDMAGDHMDGLEVVTDPNSGVAYVYVSDMTSDYLGQYERDRGGTWTQVNLFEYAGTGDHVEGMGFGALNHFWITSGASLYEIGGGDLTKYTEPEVPPT